MHSVCSAHPVGDPSDEQKRRGGAELALEHKVPDRGAGEDPGDGERVRDCVDVFSSLKWFWSVLRERRELTQPVLGVRELTWGWVANARGKLRLGRTRSRSTG